MKNETTEIKATFKAGTIFGARSACNYDCIFEAEIIRRTPKMVVVNYLQEKNKRFKIYMRDGVECFTTGSYSMAPVFDARRTLENC